MVGLQYDRMRKKGETQWKKSIRLVTNAESVELVTTL